LRLRGRLADAARVWNEVDRDTGALYRGSQLTVAQEAFAPHSETADDLMPLERDFLVASIAEHERVLKAETRTARTLKILIAAVVLLCLTGALLWLMWFINPQPREHH
jgi:hypothetical protein